MNLLAKRIIPCLDIHDGKVVKGTNFVGLKVMGDPATMASAYNQAGADELTLLDISATYQNRKTMVETIEAVSKVTFIPLTVGGGIKSLDEMYALLYAGADKISLNSAAIKNPNLITEGAKRFGTQCIVVAIDIKKHQHHANKWEVYINGGREKTSIEMQTWVKAVCEMGAGEILLTSMDTDGTKLGYDIQALKAVRELTNIPVIASGGAGTKKHILEIFEQDLADAALAASIFHFDEIKINEIKECLSRHHIPIRL